MQLPKETYIQIYKNLIQKHKFLLKLPKDRKSKLGDFRPGNVTTPHRISVNSSLPHDTFLVVLLHEIAHLVVWEQYKNKVKPHGIEWKRAYFELAKPFIDEGFFELELRYALIEFFKADTCSEKRIESLNLAISSHRKSTLPYLKDIPDSTTFALEDGRLFIKQGKNRTRLRCMSLQNKRIYFIHPLVRVVIIENYDQQRA